MAGFDLGGLLTQLHQDPRLQQGVQGALQGGMKGGMGLLNQYASLNKQGAQQKALQEALALFGGSGETGGQPADPMNDIMEKIYKAKGYNMFEGR